MKINNIFHGRQVIWKNAAKHEEDYEIYPEVGTIGRIISVKESPTTYGWTEEDILNNDFLVKWESTIPVGHMQCIVCGPNDVIII